jgi:hypothetical protein
MAGFSFGNQKARPEKLADTPPHRLVIVFGQRTDCRFRRPRPLEEIEQQDRLRSDGEAVAASEILDEKPPLAPADQGVRVPREPDGA